MSIVNDIETDAAATAAGGPVGLLLANWKAVVGGIVLLGLVTALFVTRHTLALRTKERDMAVTQYQAEVAKNGVNLASITTLLSDLAAKTAESQARAKALTDSQSQDAANQKRFDAQQKGDAGRSATLNGLVKDLPDKPGCTVPAALSAQLDGL